MYIYIQTAKFKYILEYFNFIEKVFITLFRLFKMKKKSVDGMKTKSKRLKFDCM